MGGGGIFIPLSLMDQILSVDFLTFLKVKIYINRDTLPSSLSLIKVSLGGSKDEHFSCFTVSCQTGLRQAAVAKPMNCSRTVLTDYEFEPCRCQNSLFITIQNISNWGILTQTNGESLLPTSSDTSQLSVNGQDVFKCACNFKKTLDQSW